jgi:hypothetical protein
VPKSWSMNRTAFIKGINIIHGVLIFHEILYKTKKKKEIGVVLKLGFEKTYDKVNLGLHVLLSTEKRRFVKNDFLGCIRLLKEVPLGFKLTMKVELH